MSPPRRGCCGCWSSACGRERSEVDLAYDPQLERRVALKLVHPEVAGDEANAARLLREAQALAKLAHPNVVAIHDVGRIDEGIYVAMEYVEGEVLGSWLRAEPRCVRDIVAVFVAAAQGLAAAHDAGLVHCTTASSSANDAAASAPATNSTERARGSRFSCSGRTPATRLRSPG